LSWSVATGLFCEPFGPHETKIKRKDRNNKLSFSIIQLLKISHLNYLTYWLS
jgi:hypothetical protein